MCMQKSGAPLGAPGFSRSPTADELVRWRRCISADGKRPAEALPREGRAQEFDWARTELPPIDMGQVGAAAAAAGALRSCAGARLRERARGGGALSGESTSGGAGGDKGAGKRRREGVALDRDANTGGRVGAEAQEAATRSSQILNPYECAQRAWRG